MTTRVKEKSGEAIKGLSMRNRLWWGSTNVSWWVAPCWMLALGVYLLIIEQGANSFVLALIDGDGAIVSPSRHRLYCYLKFAFVSTLQRSYALDPYRPCASFFFDSSLISIVTADGARIVSRCLTPSRWWGWRLRSRISLVSCHSRTCCVLVPRLGQLADYGPDLSKSR